MLHVKLSYDFVIFSIFCKSTFRPFLIKPPECDNFVISMFRHHEPLIGGYMIFEHFVFTFHIIICLYKMTVFVNLRGQLPFSSLSSSYSHLPPVSSFSHLDSILG